MKCLGYTLYGILIHYGLPPSTLDSTSCLLQSYQGTYDEMSVYLPPSDCHIEADVRRHLGMELDEADYTCLSDDLTELVWIHEISVDESLLASEHKDHYSSYVDTKWGNLDEQMFKAIAENAVHNLAVDGSSEQITLDSASYVTTPDAGFRLMFRSPTSSLFAIHDITSSRLNLDAIISPIHKLTVIPFPPVPFVPVSPDDLERVRALLSNLKYDKVIASTVNNISAVQLQADVTWLTGERSDSPIESRHSLHPDTHKAANWILEQIESTGASCHLSPFLPGFAPNIICRYDAIEETSALVLLSAHYDSRGSFGSSRAPGGDDDGSGTTAIISIARTIEQAGLKFKSNVELCLFAGEEQGLLGSKAYAKELREANANLTLMVQADMLAYHDPEEPAQLGFPDLIGTLEVAQLVANISELYSPELTVGITPACCSDHQSFHQQGFASTQVFERNGPIKDPMYHNSGDLSNRTGYDFEQLRSIAKVQLATLMYAAGYEL